MRVRSVYAHTQGRHASPLPCSSQHSQTRPRQRASCAVRQQEEVVKPEYRYSARLQRIIDGDTFILDVDLGFHVHTHVTVRLRDIDCPEINTEAGKAAAVAVAQLLKGPDVVI